MHGGTVALFVVGQRRVEVGEQPLPAFLHGLYMRERVVGAFAQQFAFGQIGAHLLNGQIALQVLDQRFAEGEFVFDRQFDVDAFDAI